MRIVALLIGACSFVIDQDIHNEQYTHRRRVTEATRLN